MTDTTPPPGSDGTPVTSEPRSPLELLWKLSREYSELSAYQSPLKNTRSATTHIFKGHTFSASSTDSAKKNTDASPNLTFGVVSCKSPRGTT